MKSVSSILSKLFIFIMAIITLFPFVYMILASLMTFQEATSIPPTLIPKVPQWNNFIVAMQQAPFVRYFYNTIIKMQEFIELYNGDKNGEKVQDDISSQIKEKFIGILLIIPIILPLI